MAAKYHVTSLNELSHGTKLIDGSTGRELRGIVAIDLHIAVHEPIRADVQLLGVCPDRVGIAAARFMIRDPMAGEMVAVKRVEYEDGSGFEIVDGALIQIVPHADR